MTKSSSNSVGLLYAGWFLVDVDLIVITPMLVPVAQHFHTSLATVTLALTAYLLMFGIMQPFYGNYSDSVGRVRVMRIGLAGLFVANVLASLAPNVTLLIAARGLAGAFAAALVPVTVAYVGDQVEPHKRQRAMAKLLSISALGVAAGTIGGGVLTDLVSWRLPIALVAVGGLVLALTYRKLPEFFTPDSAQPLSFRRLGAAMRTGWFPFLVIFAFVEGGPMVGFYNFFNAALQEHGSPAMVTGLITSAYGVGAVAGGFVVRLLDAKVTPALMFGGGTALLLLAYVIPALSQTIGGILAASVLSGMALSVAQSTIQDWTIEAAPAHVRGTATSLVACAVFTGGAASTAVVGGLAGNGDFGLLFGIAAAVTLPVMIVGALARARFDRSRAALVSTQ